MVTSGVAVLGGCQGGASSGTPRSTPSATTRRSPETPTDPGTRTKTRAQTPTDTYTAEPRDPRVGVDPDEPQSASVVDLETVARTCAFHPRAKTDAGRRLVRQFRATATADHPALVAGVIENGTDSDWTVPLKETFPFGPLVSDPPRHTGSDQEGSAGDPLVLAPTGNHDLVDEPPTVYRTGDGRWRVDTATLPPLHDEVTLSPADRLFAEVALVGPRTGAGTDLRPGWYRFGPRPATTVTVWDTERPGPTRSSRFEGRSIPPVGGSTAWFHEAESSTGTYLAPGIQRTDLPATVGWRLHNHSRKRYGRGRPELHKLHQGQWFEVASVSRRPATPQPLPDVLPGQSVRWRIHLAHDDGGQRSADDAVSHLGGGTYALVVPHPGGNEGGITRRTGALIALNAPDLDVVPDDDLATTRQDGTVEVTAAVRDPPASLVVSRTDRADRTVIAEQVMGRLPGLRNTLPFFDGSVEQVVLRTAQPVVDRTLDFLIPDRTDETRVTVDFRGESYRIRERPAT